MCTCALRCGCSLHPSPFPLRSVALLPALPDVFLRVPREAQVQKPVRLPLGDRGHFRPRDTPHRSRAPTLCGCASLVMVDMCCGHRAKTRSSSRLSISNAACYFRAPLVTIFTSLRPAVSPPLENPFKTNWREGLSCGPIRHFQHRIWPV